MANVPTNKEQDEAHGHTFEGHHLLFTGQAGTGKTQTIKSIYHDLKACDKNIALLCTTGIGCLQYVEIEMMQESKLTNFQQRFLEKQLRGGGTLPLACNPTSSAKKKQPKPPAKPPKYLNPKNYHSNGVRKREVIEASGAYERPDYNPGPSHWNRNSEKEKEKLANFMAFGTDLPPPSEQKRKPREYVEPEDLPEVDRFAELQAEIDERRQFLNDMEALGQANNYRTIIETEISQKIREMELVDKKRTKELEELIAREEAKKTKS